MMVKKLLVYGFFLLFSMAGYSEYNRSFSEQWIDLSYEFSAETIYWPNADTVKLSNVYEGEKESGYYYSAYQFCAPEHGGTHIDAPVHFGKGHKSIDRVPIEQLVGDAIVIDVSVKALGNRDYLINTGDFAAWESKHGRVPDNAIVLLKPGYGQYWPDRKKYMGSDKLGKEAISELHFPGLDPDAAQWLVEKRKIKAIGLDTPSIDYGQSKIFKCHQIFADKDILIFENVANIDKLPATGAYVIALPMKIKGGSGAPARIVARIPDN